MAVNDKKELVGQLLKTYDPEKDKFSEKYYKLQELRQEALRKFDWDTLSAFAEKNLVQEFARAA